MTNIKPRDNNGSIILRFSYCGTQYSLNPVPRGRYGEKIAMARATEIAGRIEMDIRAGYFDPSLAKYKPVVVNSKALRAARKEAKEQKLAIAKNEAIENAVLSVLFDEFTIFKSKILKSNSLIDYRLVRNKLEKCPHKRVKESVDIVRWLVNDHKGIRSSSVEKQLKLINACCKWAVAGKLLKDNPFEGLQKLIPTTKNSRGDDDVNPFSISERDTIIEAFKSSQSFCYYAPLVEFLFFTGCRPNEALALQWKHIKGSSVTFCQVLTKSGVIEPGTKTEKKRSITVGERTEKLLLSIKPTDTLPDSFVFTGRRGAFIDWHNFCNRAWSKVLGSLNSVEYRNPYQMRHTAITTMVRNGADSVKVAKWVGNSPNMIAKRYLGSVSDIALPE